jgi:hypothetical protein
MVALLPALARCQRRMSPPGGDAASAPAQVIQVNGDWSLTKGERAGTGLAVAVVVLICAACCGVFICTRCSFCLTSRSDIGVPKEAARYHREVKKRRKGQQASERSASHAALRDAAAGGGGTRGRRGWLKGRAPRATQASEFTSSEEDEQSDREGRGAARSAFERSSASFVTAPAGDSTGTLARMFEAVSPDASDDTSTAKSGDSVIIFGEASAGGWLHDTLAADARSPGILARGPEASIAAPRADEPPAAAKRKWDAFTFVNEIESRGLAGDSGASASGGGPFGNNPSASGPSGHAAHSGSWPAPSDPGAPRGPSADISGEAATFSSALFRDNNNNGVAASRDGNTHMGSTAASGQSDSVQLQLLSPARGTDRGDVDSVSKAASAVPSVAGAQLRPPRGKSGSNPTTGSDPSSSSGAGQSGGGRGVSGNGAGGQPSTGDSLSMAMPSVLTMYGGAPRSGQVRINVHYGRSGQLLASMVLKLCMLARFETGSARSSAHMYLATLLL